MSKLVFELQNKLTVSEYTLHDGVLFRQDRIVIPSTLRDQVLKELHETHLGIVKMKQLARRYVYWPCIDRDIERLVKECQPCALTRANPPKAPVHPWDQPEENWERVHIDYAGPFENYNFLICVDAKSKWAEVQILRDAPTSNSTILSLNRIFASHGFPVCLVSDNAAIFQSNEFRSYCSTNGIFQKFIAPGHPATNGLAERHVQILKNRLRAASDDNVPIQEKLQNILFRYRATPLACGKSPAELYLGRKMRIRLDAFFPVRPQPSILVTKPARAFQVGERIQTRLLHNNKYTWKFGKIVKKYGQRHYLVVLDDSRRTLKRHIDQLRGTQVQPKSVTFEPTQSFNIPRAPDCPALANPEIAAPPQQNPEVPDIRRSTRPSRMPVRFRDYVM